MKTTMKKIGLLLLLSTLYAPFLWAVPKPFSLTAKINGLPEGAKVKLIPAATHADEDPVATGLVKGGTFTLSGKLEEPRLFYITLEDYYGAYTLMLEPAKISLTGEVVPVERGTNKGFDFKNMVVKGSNLQALYLKKKHPRAVLDSIHTANAIKHRAVSQRRSEAINKKDSVALAAVLNSEEWKQLEADDKAFFASVDPIFSKMILDNKDTYWGPLIMLDLFSYFTDQQKPLYAQLSDKAKATHYGKVLNNVLNPEGFKGKPAPMIDIRANNSSTAVNDLSTLTKGHKYVLVDFWASWCVPCRKSIPGLKKSYEELSSKGLQIVSISIDKKEADWQKAETEEQFPWPSFLDNGKTSNAWKIRAIPATFLLDENGTVVGENLTLAELAAKFN